MIRTYACRSSLDIKWSHIRMSLDCWIVSSKNVSWRLKSLIQECLLTTENSYPWISDDTENIHTGLVNGFANSVISADSCSFIYKNISCPVLTTLNQAECWQYYQLTFTDIGCQLRKPWNHTSFTQIAYWHCDRKFEAAFSYTSACYPNSFFWKRFLVFLRHFQTGFSCAWLSGHCGTLN